MLRRSSFIAATLLLAPGALACSCIPFGDLSPTERAEMLRRYPIVVEAQLVRSDKSLACRSDVAAWVYSVFEWPITVDHRVRVQRVRKGRAPRDLVIRQAQYRAGDACTAGGSAACEHEFGPGPEIMVLSARRPDGKYERASTCASFAVLEATS